MARINIEDSIFKDGRFIELCVATGGSRYTALGALAWLWIEAQEYYLKYGFIPDHKWIQTGLPEYLITTGWASRVNGGVEACGQEEQFAWLKQKSNSGKSLSQKKMDSLQNARQKKSDKSLKETLNGCSVITERTLNGSEALTLTLPLTLTQFSNSNSNSNSNSEKRKGTENIDSANLYSEGLNSQQTDGVNLFIAAYCEAYKIKYGVSPVISDQVGVVKNIIKALTLKRAIDVIPSYLAMTDRWLVIKRHDLFTMKGNLNAILQFHETGMEVKDPTSILYTEKVSHSNQALLEKLRRGEI